MQLRIKAQILVTKMYGVLTIINLNNESRSPLTKIISLTRFWTLDCGLQQGPVVSKAFSLNGG